MNKKLGKILASLALAGTVTVGAVGLTSCAATNSFYGEYSYPNAWSPSAPYYGIKVKVDVQSDGKGDRIKQVEIIDSVYTEVSDGWASKDTWLNAVDQLLLSYRGKYLADVLTETVRVSSSTPGQPEEVSDSDLMISGATQGSGRLLLAVQAALEDAAQQLGYTVSTGEYHYPNAWAPTAPQYGLKVRVVVKDDTILGVAILNSGYTEVSSGWAGKSTWTNNVYELLKHYKGQKVDYIKSLSPQFSGTPSEESGSSTPGQVDAITDENLVQSGATQGSGRLLLAIQAALGKEVPQFPFADEMTQTTYAKYTDSASGVGVKVKVMLNVPEMSEDRTKVLEPVRILSVSVMTKEAGDSYTELDWGNYKSQAGDLLNSYSNKTLGQVLTAKASDFAITGAEKQSEIVLNAVKDALSMGGAIQVYSGEYKYLDTIWTQHDYGIKVNVVAGDGYINEVLIEKSDYTEVSDSWEGKTTWTNGVNNLLKSYIGKSFGEILATEVVTNPGGPYAPAGQPEKVSDSRFVVSGATQGSGRVMLAVQNAISKAPEAADYKTAIGEYSYDNTWQPGTKYGIKVKVAVLNDMIVGITVIHDGYIEVTDNWENKDTWLNGVDALVQKYVGKSVSEIQSIQVTTNPGGPYVPAGQPETVTGTDDLVITGATQGSGRLVLAVQDALSKLV